VSPESARTTTATRVRAIAAECRISQDMLRPYRDTPKGQACITTRRRTNVACSERWRPCPKIT
jgi:hypothetical protein